ncbi:MAG: hypothetical protein KIT62_09490 [Cyclobacteriaceae bacterium]|nr:hypothetical protein [Cyclobacteriaceae bacterium]
MKKLEDIPKKDPFKAPDGYFDQLPGIIQARITKPKSHTIWIPVLKFALPVVAFIAAGVFWFSDQATQPFEDQLAGINTEELIAYLDNTEFAWEDTEEITEWNEDDVLDFEDRVYSTFTTDNSDLDLLENELIELENL